MVRQVAVRKEIALPARRSLFSLETTMRNPLLKSETVAFPPSERFDPLHGSDFTELRLLTRVAFYASLKRRAPLQLRSVPSYVRAVQRKLDLPSRNAARAVLASIEGFDNWRDLVREMMQER